MSAYPKCQRGIFRFCAFRRFTNHYTVCIYNYFVTWQKYDKCCCQNNIRNDDIKQSYGGKTRIQKLNEKHFQCNDTLRWQCSWTSLPLPRSSRIGTGNVRVRAVELKMITNSWTYFSANMFRSTWKCKDRIAARRRWQSWDFQQSQNNELLTHYTRSIFY